MDSLIALDFTLVPTFVAYLASRDLMRQSRNIWHALYTMPSLWEFYRPNRRAHGSYWFYWTIKDGILYDAKALLADVRRMVDAARADAGIPPTPMPMFIETMGPEIIETEH